jgi:hypothetical protein
MQEVVGSSLSYTAVTIPTTDFAELERSLMEAQSRGFRPIYRSGHRWVLERMRSIVVADERGELQATAQTTNSLPLEGT